MYNIPYVDRQGRRISVTSMKDFSIVKVPRCVDMKRSWRSQFFRHIKLSALCVILDNLCHLLHPLPSTVYYTTSTASSSGYSMKVHDRQGGRIVVTSMMNISSGNIKRVRRQWKTVRQTQFFRQKKFSTLGIRHNLRHMLHPLPSTVCHIFTVCVVAKPCVYDGLFHCWHKTGASTTKNHMTFSIPSAYDDNSITYSIYDIHFRLQYSIPWPSGSTRICDVFDDFSGVDVKPMRRQLKIQWHSKFFRHIMLSALCVILHNLHHSLPSTLCHTLIVRVVA